MRKFKRLSRKLLFAFLTFLGALLVYLLFNPLLIGYVYDFSEPQPFQGKNWYNPYENLDAANWKKANFHAHSHTALGLNGDHSEEYQEIRAKYEELGYEIINVSDYMFINEEFKEQADYIPIYEHGYSFKKTHQLVLGGKNVNYFDYTLYSFTSNKQFMINQLQNNSKAVALAHPSLLNGYTEKDIKYLTNYDLFEAVSRFCMSTELWDVALSNGKPAFIIANDDMHDIENPNEVGMVCTVINTRELSEDKIINSMKSGKAYALEMRKHDLDWESKKKYTRNFTKLENVVLDNDQLNVEVNKPILQAKFIGQNGKNLKTYTPEAGNEETEVNYTIQKEDRYIRTEITTIDGHKIYLNPVYRFEDDPFLFSNTAAINWPLTLLLKLIPIASLAFFTIFISKIRRVRKKRKAIPRLH